MKSINFIFFGRLEKEKGFDLVLDLINYFQGNKNLHFYIFGEGILSNKIPSFENISFFGRRKKSEIQQYLRKSHFSLMPSRFLETFGLSALESCDFGVTVVGFKKGGLENFVFDELDINRQSGQTDKEKFINLVKNLLKSFSTEEHNYMSDLSLKTAEDYKLEKWLQKFEKKLSSDGVKKILLCSDFIKKIGGIENYIRDVKKVLEKRGYTVELFGLNYKGKIGKFFKHLGIFVSFVNFWYGFKLKRKIKDFNPDLIWFNSISRFLGHFSIRAVRKFNGDRLMMYHDLGYFHPFPAKVEEEKQIEKKFGFKSFIKMANTKNPFKLFFVIGKYMNLVLLKNKLKKNIDKHLVPSEFMVDIVSQSYEVENVSVLPHFLERD